MRKSPKFLCLILVIAILISNATMLGIVFAQTAETEPLKIEVTTDKTSYNLLNTAKITVKVTNVSGETIENVSAEAVFNELIPVGKDSQTTAETEKLEAGQSIEFSYNAMLSPNASGINIFQKILLTIKRFFAGSISVSDNGFDDGRACIKNDTKLYIGNRNIYNFVNVWFENENHYDFTWSYTVDSSHVIVVDEKGNGYVDNMIIVFAGFRTTAKEKDFEELLKQIDGEIVGKTFVGGVYQIQVPATTKSQLLEWCKYLQTSELVFSAHLNETIWYEIDEVTGLSNLSQAIPNDPWKDTFQGISGTDWDETNPNGLNWWMEAIEAPSAWDYDDKFNSIKIGVVDDGFDTSHKDLDITVLNKNDNSIENHGTHVAGVIGATANNRIGITGIVWNKELICADVEATQKQIDNNISVWNDIIGIINVIDDGAKVVNISRTLEGKNLHEETFDEIYSSGWKAVNCIVWCKEQLQKNDFIIVQASGNDTVNAIRAGLFCSITTDVIDRFMKEYDRSGFTYEDIMNHILIVGAVEKTSKGYYMTDFSNYGSQITISAPGKGIFSTVASGGLDGDYEYKGYDGTSMAAPMVTGVASLVWSVNPNFTAGEVKEIVCNYTNKSAIGHGNDTNTYKIVNAKLAVEEAIKQTYSSGTLKGKIVNVATQEYIPLANINIEATEKSTNKKVYGKTENDGTFSVILPTGTYDIKFIKGACEYIVEQVSISNDMELDLGLLKTIIPISRITGTVRNKETNKPISNVSVWIEDNYYINSSDNCSETITDENGYFELEIFCSDDCTIGFSCNNYETYEINVDCSELTKNFDVMMKPYFDIFADYGALTDSGSCGTNAFWSFYEETGTIVIHGSGYVSSVGLESPWYQYKEKTNNVVIENGIRNIVDYAFQDFTCLTNITIPDSVIEISNYAFRRCDSLTTITIPNSVVIIDKYAFENCYSLEDITVDDNNPYYSSDNCGVLFDKNKKTLIKYPSNNNRTSYTIPESVTTIENSAFSGCTSLSSISIPDSVTNIGESAFAHCKKLNSITISNNLTTISRDMFRGCTSLTSISIPNSVIAIEDSAFFGCAGLTSVTIPNSVITIGAQAFWYCSNITKVTIPNSVITIGNSAFHWCDSLSDIYYSGTQEQWNNINKEGNNSLYNITIHYNS